MKGEYNRAWVRNKIREMGLEEEIGQLAYARFVARYMSVDDVSREFFEIVEAVSER